MIPSNPSDYQHESQNDERVPEHQDQSSRIWVNAQIEKYKKVYSDYKEYAKVLQEILQHKSQEIAPQSIVQARAKSIDSFAEKALLKRNKYPDPVNQFTDLCGARIIARTRSEVNSLCEFIKHNFIIDWENSVDTSQRLKPTEFGYRSIHYIVSLRSDIDYNKTSLSEELFYLKAEVQVRTMVEHAYADFAHDLTYKGSFELPGFWQRQLAGAAAALEEADQAFTRVEEKLKEYRSSYDKYLSEAELQQEISIQEIILEHIPGNLKRAARLGKLYMRQGDLRKAVNLLDHYVDQNNPEGAYQPILRDLGVALCKVHSGKPESQEYKQGRRYLELAVAPPHSDPDALASLAGTYKGFDEERMREYYRQAFEIDPYDPYVLGNYLECELPKNPGLLKIAHPLIEKSLERCQAQVKAEVNLPWALYDMGTFYLLLGKPYKGLEAYCKALKASSAEFMIETSMKSLERLNKADLRIQGYTWAHRLLLLGLASKFSSTEALQELQKLASKDAPPIQGPVLIVAGGTDQSIQDQMLDYSQILLEALAGFDGTVLSGGTRQGISGIVGQACEAYPGTFHTIGYLPELVPSNAQVDNDTKRQNELRFTDGQGFSPQEPLQGWTDLVSSGIQPREVRLLGINGGEVAASEYTIALSLGATVGLVAQSGREAGRLLMDNYWATSPNLLGLPRDAQTLKAFVTRGLFKTLLGEHKENIELIAQAIHEEYRANRSQAVLDQKSDPALLDWDKLPLDYKESSRDQAQHIFEKLQEIGCSIAEAGNAAGGRVTAFSDEEIEHMARMEHGRYVAERLMAGWKWGEKRDPESKTSPYLVRWEELPGDVKELDRKAVKKIPDFLESLGLQIQRLQRRT